MVGGLDRGAVRSVEVVGGADVGGSGCGGFVTTWDDDVRKGQGGEATVRVQIRLTPDRVAKLDRIGERYDRSRSSVVRMLVDRVVEDS